jgi:hypothetical protein
MSVHTFLTVLGFMLLIAMTVCALTIRAAMKGNKRVQSHNKGSDRKHSTEPHNKDSDPKLSTSPDSDRKLTFKLTVTPQINDQGARLKTDFSVTKHSYTIPPHVSELIKEHRDQEAIAEIRAATGFDEERANELLKEMQGIHREIHLGSFSAKVTFHPETHSYKLPKEVVDMIRQGRQDEAIEQFHKESGLSLEQSKEIICKVRDSLGLT